MAGEMKVRADVKSSQIEAVVIRADGTREELGVISYYHKNPLMMAYWYVKQRLKARFN